MPQITLSEIKRLLRGPHIPGSPQELEVLRGGERRGDRLGQVRHEPPGRQDHAELGRRRQGGLRNAILSQLGS